METVAAAGLRVTAATIEVVRLQAWHLKAIRAQSEQASEVEAQGLDVPAGDAWAVLSDGKPVAAGGFTEIWHGRGYAWALFAQRWPVKSAIRAIRSKLADAQFPRLEMVVDVEFEKAAAFAEYLGFELEHTAKRYLPNGHDAHIYVRFA